MVPRRVTLAAAVLLPALALGCQSGTQAAAPSAGDGTSASAPAPSAPPPSRPVASSSAISTRPRRTATIADPARSAASKPPSTPTTSTTGAGTTRPARTASSAAPPSTTPAPSSTGQGRPPPTTTSAPAPSHRPTHTVPPVTPTATGSSPSPANCLSAAQIVAIALPSGGPPHVSVTDITCAGAWNAARLDSPDAGPAVAVIHSGRLVALGSSVCDAAGLGSAPAKIRAVAWCG